MSANVKVSEKKEPAVYEVFINQVADQEDLTRIADHPDGTHNLVLLHGLGGGSMTTWMADTKNLETFWPLWLVKEPGIAPLGIWTLGYQTSVSKWVSDSLPLEDQGNSLLDLLHVNGLLKKPLLFITHSMGGIVLKQILRNAHSGYQKKWKPILERTRGIVFISTPHKGSIYADFASFARKILKTHENVDGLTLHNGRLESLHNDFLNFWNMHHPVVRSFGENRRIQRTVRILGVRFRFSSPFLVVDRLSAEPGVPEEVAISLNEDHIGICKPSSRRKHLYASILQFLRDCCTSGTAPLNPPG